MGLKKLTGAAEYKEALRANSKVCIVFYADWCEAWCSVKEAVAERSSNSKSVAVYAVSVDEDSALAQNEGIVGLPTFVFFENKVKIDELCGGDQTRFADKLSSLEGVVNSAAPEE
eukprot:Nk52_evm77s914 gene=Nk52_evmTU77s914